MDGTPRRRSQRAGSRGPRQRWRPTGFVKPTSTDESPTSAVEEAAVAADGLGAASADGQAAVAAAGLGAELTVGESPASPVGWPTFHASPDAFGAASAVAADGGGVADAVDLQRVQGGVASCPCPLGEADGTDDDDEADGRTVSVSTFQPGDSIYQASAQSDLESDEDDQGSAVAADDAQPKETIHTRRSKRQPRNITPEEQKLQSK